MRKYAALLGVLAMGAVVYASDITIYDGISNNNTYNGTAWYGGGSYDSRVVNGIAVREDHEVEPGCIGAQAWDLEAFTLEGNDLGLVGGYNFKDGYQGTYGGDIFIATGSVPQYGASNTGGGSGNAVVQNTFGYDYAIDLIFNANGTTGTYNVYELDNASTVTVFYQQNDESNPVSYNAGGTFKTSGSFDYAAGTSNTISGIDLSFLGSNTEFWSHYTMSCGNDNLMGHGTTAVPEPGTLMMLGTGLLGLLGLTFIRRRKK